jgi:hypothetical protein
MDLYLLDGLLRRETVVDRYKSLIWTERYQEAGDFQLVVQSTLENRQRYKAGRWLALNESYRVMKIETVQDKIDEEGAALLEISGPSIEIILDDRVAFNVKDDLTTNPKWTITDKPGDVARKVFHDICVTGILDTHDIIPFMASVALLPADNIPEPGDDVTVEIEPDTVYNVIKGICEPYDLGFRLLRNFDNSQLVFDIYSGVDRTSAQTVYPSVIFSPDLENLRSTTELKSISGVKNMAYVYSNLGFEVVVATDVDPNLTGFERQVLVVKMDDIDVGTAPAVVTALMQQKGREELAKVRSFQGFDGEVTQSTQYKYGTDYQLGDLVELHGKDGIASNMRVTEQIFVNDDGGERSYPTLTVKQLVTPGSWLAEGTTEWIDYDDDATTWADKP